MPGRRHSSAPPIGEREPRIGDETKFHLVGGGIASLAAAAFLIRDGDVLGSNITIFEETGPLGGSLDASGSPQGIFDPRVLLKAFVALHDLAS
jgi:oleate hydratase